MGRHVKGAPFGMLALTLAGCGGNAFGVVSADGGNDATAVDDSSSQVIPEVGPVSQEAAPACQTGGAACGNSCCSADQACLDGQCCGIPPGQGICVVSTQCGCPTGQKCSRAGGAPEACSVVGVVPPGGSCTLGSDCEGDYECSDGLCEQLCGTCAINWACSPQYHPNPDGGAAVVLGYSVCEPHCNPGTPFVSDVAHQACGSGQRCNVTSTGATYCSQPAGAGVQNSPCQVGDDCAATFGCVGVPGQCKEYCRIGTDDCPDFRSCDSFTPEQFDGKTQIGFCK